MLFPGINTIQDSAPPRFWPDLQPGYSAALPVRYKIMIGTVITDIPPGGMLNTGDQRDVSGGKNQGEVCAPVINHWPAVPGAKVADRDEIIVGGAEVAAGINPVPYSCPVGPGC